MRFVKIAALIFLLPFGVVYRMLVEARVTVGEWWSVVSDVWHGVM